MSQDTPETEPSEPTNMSLFQAAYDMAKLHPLTDVFVYNGVKYTLRDAKLLLDKYNHVD